MSSFVSSMNPTGNPHSMVGTGGGISTPHSFSSSELPDPITRSSNLSSCLPTLSQKTKKNIFQAIAALGGIVAGLSLAAFLAGTMATPIGWAVGAGLVVIGLIGAYKYGNVKEALKTGCIALTFFTGSAVLGAAIFMPKIALGYRIAIGILSPIMTMGSLRETYIAFN